MNLDQRWVLGVLMKQDYLNSSEDQNGWNKIIIDANRTSHSVNSREKNSLQASYRFLFRLSKNIMVISRLLFIEKNGSIQDKRLSGNLTVIDF